MNYTKSLILAIAAAGILSAPAFAATRSNKGKAITTGKVAIKTVVAVASLASALLLGNAAIKGCIEDIQHNKSLVAITLAAVVYGTAVASAAYVGVKSAQSAINDIRNFNK